MTPVIHGAGAGGAGLMLYVTHDVGSRDTSDRVAWTASVNLPVDDGPSCGKLMRRTVNDAADLKAAAGVATTGRKLKKPFEHMSISWAPDERPTKDTMTAAALEAIEARGYSGCQAFIACHTDRDHPHVHIVTCRVDPKTGRTRKPTHARKLQRWAEDYEQRTGGIRIPNRRERRLVREHNAQEIRAAVKEERRPALRRMPAMETKRSRGPTGHAIRKRTADERRQWSALLAEQERGHTAGPTPAQARSDRVALARRQTVAQLEAGNQRAERFERLAAAAAVLPMKLGPAPERPRADLAQVRIEAPAAAVLPMKLGPAPERPRADLAQVRIEAPAPVPSSPMKLGPAPERPRADLAQVRIEAPAPVPSSPMKLGPAPERPRADLDEETRREEERQSEERREEAEETQRETERLAGEEERRKRDQAAAAAAAEKLQREFTAAIRLALDEDTYKAADDLAAHQPAGLPWDEVEAELETRRATDDRYTQRLQVGGAMLDVGVSRSDLEEKILDHAEHQRSRLPPAPPNRVAAAISAAVDAIQAAAERLISRILERLRVRDPAPAAAQGAPLADEHAAQAGGEDRPAGPGGDTVQEAPAAARPTTRDDDAYGQGGDLEERGSTETVAGGAEDTRARPRPRQDQDRS